MVTITDIARRLGVAVSTVSKGLNGANDVSESTRALILKTAVEMGYAGRKVQNPACGRSAFSGKGRISFRWPIRL